MGLNLKKLNGSIVHTQLRAQQLFATTKLKKNKNKHHFTECTITEIGGKKRQVKSFF
jgi:hypothetical protein